VSAPYQIVTDQIIKQLENGVVPWRKPWTTQFPKSLRSLREYRGLNVLMLASQGYASPYWLTFNQAKQLGGHVKQGEHSTLVTFWKRSPYKKHNEETGEDETRNGFLLRYYRVFNLCQTEEIADKLGLSVTAESGSNRVPSLDQCEKIVAEMPLAPKREQSFAAWYRPLTDTVGMPNRDTFHSSEEYYSTLFHELAHSTGHPSRVGRDGIENVNSFASESYSKEELIAEMSSAFLCGVAGVSPVVIQNSASYLQSWISRLRGDARLLISAASHAQKAADYILNRKPESLQNSDESEAA
jgi:antirestriction protein ArdC